MKNKFLCSILLLFIALKIECQIVFNDLHTLSYNSTTIKKYQEANFILDSLFDLGLKIGRADIFSIDSNDYMILNGQNYLFKWNKMSWNNISKSKYHGFNFGSYKFKYQKALYQFGGYGFWKTNNDLIRFDNSLEEWEIVSIPMVNSIGSNISFVFHNNLYIVNPTLQEQGIDKNESTNYCYVYHLDSNYIDKFKVLKTKFELKYGMGLNMKDYFLVQFNPFQLIHKNSILKIGESDMTVCKTFYEINYRSFVGICNNDLLINIDKELWMPGIIRIDSLVSNNNIQFNLLLSKESLLKNKSTLIGLFIFLIIIIASGGFLLYLRKIKSSKHSDYLNKILSYSGQTIVQEDLDSIFEIGEKVSPETRRVKRKTLIDQINREHEQIRGIPLISREKENSDKRRYLYRIN